MSLPAKPAIEREVPIASPVTGRVIDLADVPDPVFSSKAVGDGLGVEPDDGTIVSPVDATVTMVAGTGHAIGFKADSGLEVLVHLGVDTVELEGEVYLQANASEIAQDTDRIQFESYVSDGSTAIEGLLVSVVEVYQKYRNPSFLKEPTF